MLSRSFWCSTNSLSHPVVQNFVPTLASIFMSVKDFELKECKIPLLFTEDDYAVVRWVEIEKDYIKGKLPDAQGNVQKNYDLKRKPFVQNDLKPLYGLRPEDIYFLADLVERMEIFVKGSKATKGDKVARLPSLQAAGNRECLMRVMKNELMNHFKKFELPSQKSTYVMYSCEDWDDFAKEKSITRAELESWLDKAYATIVGKKWMDDQDRNLNKTSDPKDCPDVVKAMWDAHIYATNQALVAADIHSKFAGKYKYVVLDKLRPDLAGLLASEDVYQWRGGGKTHLFFYFLFDKHEDRSVKPDLLDKVRLRRIFEPLEAAEPNGGSFAKSRGVIFPDDMGFHAVVSHLETRLQKSKQKVWNWHVVHYVPSREDEFPEPSVGTSYVVYIIFCFGNVGTQPTNVCFKDYFSGRTAMEVVYQTKDITETTTQWRWIGRPTIKLAALSTLFQAHLRENMVVVNVNGRAHFTHLGLVSSSSQSSTPLTPDISFNYSYK